jgi:hypothetical protein
VVVAPWTIVDIFFYAINTAGMLNSARSKVCSRLDKFLLVEFKTSHKLILFRAKPCPNLEDRPALRVRRVDELVGNERTD